MSAADSTKIVISPYIQAPNVEAGAARTFGGGNETLGGVEQIIGREINMDDHRDLIDRAIDRIGEQ
jgi:hypothetical protein